MNAETQISEKRIWNAGGSRGEMTSADLEMTAGASPQLLDFAHGWRVRENKVGNY
jgi:hypothetical protein